MAGTSLYKSARANRLTEMAAGLSPRDQGDDSLSSPGRLQSCDADNACDKSKPPSINQTHRPNTNPQAPPPQKRSSHISTSRPRPQTGSQPPPPSLSTASRPRRCTASSALQTPRPWPLIRLPRQRRPNKSMCTTARCGPARTCSKPSIRARSRSASRISCMGLRLILGRRSGWYGTGRTGFE